MIREAICWWLVWRVLTCADLSEERKQKQNAKPNAHKQGERTVERMEMRGERGRGLLSSFSSSLLWDANEGESRHDSHSS